MEGYSYVNYHAHIPMMFWIGRGAEKGKNWVNTWWDSYIEPIERILTKEDVRVLAGAYALVCLNNNISEVWDMYFFEEKVAEVLTKYGIKVNIGEAVMTNSPTGFEGIRAIEETEKLLKKFVNNPLVDVCVGYIGPYEWASNIELTKACSDFAIKHNIPVHTHGPGNEGDVEGCKKIYGMMPIEVLEEYGFFSDEIPEIVIAHCGVLDEKEIDILEKYKDKIKIAVCPRAAAKLEYSKAPVKELINRGIKVVLGGDGGSPSGIPDIKEEIRIASEVYGVDVGYFEEVNRVEGKLKEISEDERVRIIREWHFCLERLAERAGFEGEKRVEFLESKNTM